MAMFRKEWEMAMVVMVQEANKKSKENDVVAALQHARLNSETKSTRECKTTNFGTLKSDA